MVEFLLFLFWLVIAGLAAVGAVRVFEWLDGSGDRVEAAERERQAELEIQNISYQAQMAMLNEALKRSRGDARPPRSTVVRGEVISSGDGTNEPS